MLFTPGPVMTSAAQKQALMHPDMPHRRPAFEKVFESARGHLMTLWGADSSYSTVLVTGSGSAANECALSSIVRPGEEVLLVSNGPFGERLEEILACYNVKAHVLKSAWGTLPDLAAAQKLLTDNPAITWVGVVWHETGAGLRNPVRALGELAHRLGRKVFVDCVSAFGGEDINVIRDHIDVATSVGNKCVGAMTGVAFVIARRSAVPALGPDMPRRNMYLNLQSHLKWADTYHQTPNTPAVTMIVALDFALQEIIREGLAVRIARILECSKVIRDGVRALGLKLLLPDDQFCTMLTSAELPEGVKVEDFIDALDTRGYVVYPGKGPFHARNVFQVATMGAITVEDCKGLMKVIASAIADLKRAAA